VGNCYALGLVSSILAIFTGGWNQLVKYPSLSTGATSTLLSLPANFWPQGMVVDAAGTTMYISDTAAASESATAGKIWKVTLPSALTSASMVTALTLTLSGASYTMGAPKQLAIVGSNLYFVESMANKFSKIDVSSGAVTNLLTSNIARPMGVAVDAAETFAYVSTWTTPANVIIKVDLSTLAFTNLDTVTAAYGLTLSGNYLFATSHYSLVQVSTTASPTPNPTPSPTPGPTMSPMVPTATNSSKASAGGESNYLGLIALVALVPVGCICFYFFFYKSKDKQGETSTGYAKTPNEVVVPESELALTVEQADANEVVVPESELALTVEQADANEVVVSESELALTVEQVKVDAK